MNEKHSWKEYFEKTKSSPLEIQNFCYIENAERGKGMSSNYHKEMVERMNPKLKSIRK